MNLESLIRKGQKSKAEGLKVILQLKAQILGSKDENLIQRIAWLRKELKKDSGNLSWARAKFFKGQKKLIKHERMLNSLVFQIVAESLGEKVEFVKLGKKLTVKFISPDAEEYYSLSDHGQKLSEDDVYDILHFDPEIKVLSYKDIIESYLELLADEIETKAKNSEGPLLKIYEALLAIRGFDSRILLKRVEILNQLGDWATALADLKRYLSFNNLESLPLPLKKLYFAGRTESKNSH